MRLGHVPLGVMADHLAMQALPQLLADVTVPVLHQPLADVPVAVLIQPLVVTFLPALHRPLAAVPVAALCQLLVDVTLAAPQLLLADFSALQDVPLYVLPISRPPARPLTRSPTLHPAR